MFIPKPLPALILFFLASSLPAFTQAQAKRDGCPSHRLQAPGVVSFTFRKSFALDFAGTLDSVKKFGITDIEFSNLFGKTAAEIRQELDKRHLTCSSFGVSYEDLLHKTAEVASNAKTLGASFVRLAWFPHKGKFTPADAQRAAGQFDSIGSVLLEKDSLHFVYHNHGYEFEPDQVGTLYDYIVQHTNLKYVNFELDILWAFFPGQNPAALLNKYPNRFKLMHLKDLRKGVQGNSSGGTDQNNDVALGTGQLNLTEILRAAKRAGVEHAYLEDESSHSFEQVPESLGYLKKIGL